MGVLANMIGSLDIRTDDIGSRVLNATVCEIELLDYIEGNFYTPERTSMFYKQLDEYMKMIWYDG